ncbi:MAG: serine/threonine-protein kinase, partial [Kofleriaceae bacterium]
MTSEACVEPAALAALVDDRVGPAERAAIAGHLARCAQCRRACSELVRGRGEPAAADPEGHVGRYRLGEPLGAGAMGVVFHARDPLLDRPLAIKVIDGQGLDDGARARLLREARALARVSAPGIVACYDAGIDDGDVFVAMELIRGPNLRAWAAGRPAWPAAVRALLEAARGLAAAHRAGIVHRDVKPDNILVRDDGRAAIGDFGLARPAPEEAPPAAPAASDLRSTLGRGTLAAGTPRYLAPEVRAGAAATAASDQFAFCLTVVEAIAGDPAAVDALPRPVQRIVRRGLADDPAARWPSMDALADQLARIASPRRRRWRIVAGALALAAAAAVVAWLVRPDRPAERTCGDPPALEVPPTLDGHGPAAARLHRALDERRRLWRAACLGPERRRDEPAQPRACLEERDELARAILRALGDPALAAHAAGQLDDSLRYGLCRPGQTASSLPRPPGIFGALAETARLELLRADQRSDAGDHAGAIALLERLRWIDGVLPGLGAEIHGEIAIEHELRGAPAEATAELARARALAAAPLERASMLLRVARFYANSERAPEVLHALVRELEPLVAQLGNRGFDADLAYLHSVTALAANQVPAAAAAADRGHELARAIFGDDDPAIAPFLIVRARAATVARDPAAAERDFLRAIEVYERARGAAHPTTLWARLHLTTYRMWNEQWGRARGELVALVTAAAAQPSARDLIANARVNLCTTATHLALPTAVEECRAALAFTEQVYGPAHAAMANALFQLTEAYLATEDDRIL